MTPMPDPAFVAAARRRPQIWRLLAGLATAAAIYAAGVAVFLGGYAAFQAASAPPGAIPEMPSVGETPRDMVLLLASFGFMALGGWAAARLLHGRALREMTGPAGPFWREAWVAAAVLLLVNLPFLAGALVWGDLAPNLAPGAWLVLLVPALALVGLQTFAEELVFRGYLQGQLMARFARPAIWLWTPAILFGLAHYDPSRDPVLAWSVIAAITLFGLLCGDLTARTGRLGLAWGLHLANNAVSLLFVGFEEEMSGLALYLSEDDLEDSPWLVALDAGLLVLVWAILRALLPRLARPGGRA